MAGLGILCWRRSDEFASAGIWFILVYVLLYIGPVYLLVIAFRINALLHCLWLVNGNTSSLLGD